MAFQSSGKSIIIEAISVALGARADSSLIRHGKDKSKIQIVLDNSGDEIILTREILTTGTSSCKINGELVTLSTLSQFCKNLADIHGQYDHQSLLNPDNHISLVDTYSKETLAPFRLEVSSTYSSYIKEKQKLDALNSSISSNARKRDFMKYELDELKGSNLVLDEDIELSKELTILQHSEKIYQNLSTVYETIYSENNSSFSELGKSMHNLKEISDFDPSILEFENIISDSYYKIEDLSFSIRKYLDKIDFSQSRIDEIITRLEFLNNLKKKYNKNIAGLIEYMLLVSDELLLIENSDEILSQLKFSVENLKAELVICSDILSKQRISISKTIITLINQELKELNFNNANFEIMIADRLDDKKNIIYSENGKDRVEFMISTNKGEPKKPLSKIASGGEISRIMLAFKRIIGAFDEIPTMVFDEIDIGISGSTASIVGKKLKEISKDHQVICITHLPQIAAMGDFNYKIAKHSDEKQTYTDLVLLNEIDKTSEIARLLGGFSITDNTLKNAAELIANSNF